MIHTLTLCRGGCGLLKVFFFSLVMTSTPLSVCIRIRFSEYSTVPAMIPAEESVSSGIKLILSYFPISPSVSLRALLIYSENRKPIDKHTV